MILEVKDSNGNLVLTITLPNDATEEDQKLALSAYDLVYIEQGVEE